MPSGKMNEFENWIDNNKSIVQTEGDFERAKIVWNAAIHAAANRAANHFLRVMTCIIPEKRGISDDIRNLEEKG